MWKLALNCNILHLVDQAQFGWYIGFVFFSGHVHIIVRAELDSTALPRVTGFVGRFGDLYNSCHCRVVSMSYATTLYHLNGLLRTYFL